MTVPRLLVRDIAGNAQGATIVEFALVFPVFLMAVVGGLYMGMLGFSTVSLQNAVRDAARCYALGLSACDSATKAQTYARSRFVSVTSDVPIFIASTQACGRQIDASVAFTFNAGLYKANVPLTARSCFPA